MITLIIDIQFLNEWMNEWKVSKKCFKNRKWENWMEIEVFSSSSSSSSILICVVFSCGLNFF